MSGRSRWNALLMGVFILGVILLAGCQVGPDRCPMYSLVNLENPDSFAENNQLYFQFPLEDSRSYSRPIMTNFAICGQDTKWRRECHAAEDYRQQPGTPVYAIADGTISFSGTAGGYGWLIIIDHPQANLYSLYGHLSPSRWQAEEGPVEKGELIGYLGDSDENGGTAEAPLEPHLHLGIRAGQRLDYPGSSEWRWMAGWISKCPQDTGWLQPAVVINNQEIPPGGFPNPAGNFFEIWWFTIVFGFFYLGGWIRVLSYANRNQRPQLLLLSAVVFLLISWVFSAKEPRLGILLFTLGLLAIALGSYRLLRRSDQAA